MGRLTACPVLGYVCIGLSFFTSHRLGEKYFYLQVIIKEKLDEGKNEGKLLKAIVDLLGDMAQEIADLNENAMDLAEEIDQISDDLKSC